MKPKMRVVDVPANSSAAEAEALINAPLEDGYYSTYQTTVGLLEGICLRFFYALRVKPEKKLLEGWVVVNQWASTISVDICRR